MTANYLALNILMLVQYHRKLCQHKHQSWPDFERLYFKLIVTIFCIFSILTGGSLGLFTGMSLLSIIECAYWFLAIIIILLNRFIRRRNWSLFPLNNPTSLKKLVKTNTFTTTTTTSTSTAASTTANITATAAVGAPILLTHQDHNTNQFSFSFSWPDRPTPTPTRMLVLRL